MSNDVKRMIRREYLKCAQDVSYFLSKYSVIQHPLRGKIKFELYNFQDSILSEFEKNSYNIVLKSRQLGLSTLVAGYSLHMMIFNSDKNILVIATGKDVAKNLITKVRIMYQSLPAWLKANVEEDNKLSLRFTNGSQIKAIASTESAGRSESLSLLILDECGFIDQISEIWTAAQQTLATGGDCIALSTPNGIGNWFHKTWIGAVDGNNSFNFIGPLHWSLHPDRNEEWREEQDKILGPSKASQECDADFLSSGNSVVDPQIIQWYKENQVTEPVEKTGADRNLWIWDYPDYSKQYIVAADVARGDSSDYSTAQVFELEDLEQAAEYKGQLSTTDFGNFLIDLSTKYNDALLIVENNNVGWATIQTIIDRGYDNLFYQTKDLQYIDVEHQIDNKYRRHDKNMIPGFSTTIKTKPLIIAKMEEYTRERMTKLKSVRLIEELFVYIFKNNKTCAAEGYNDDLVIAYAICLWIRDTALRLKSEKNDAQRALMSSLLKSNKGYDAGFSKGKIKPKDNPWEIDINGEKEDLGWLL
tara:strand:+ start:4898 stop:6487 length:1590 start_codon:yes stop_codon:yes gene_type:complete